MGSVSGPTIAAIFLAMLPAVLRVVQKWRLVLYGALMILVMLFKPEGLMGGRELFSGRNLRAKNKEAEK